MTIVVLTIHVLIVLGLIVVVLLQRSEGGALGMGAGTGGGFMSGRSAANALTRTTSILAGLFFATSLGLAVFAGADQNDDRVIEELTGSAGVESDANLAPDISAPTADDILNSLGANPEDPENASATDLPLTETEILDSLGTDVAPVDSAASDAGDESAETPDAPQ